jgi:hypothetical protein
MPPRPAPSDTHHTGRLAVTALGAAVFTLASYGLAGSLFVTTHRGSVGEGATVGLATLLAAILLLALTPLARRAAPLRYTYALAAALAAQGFLPLAGAGMKLADPLVSSFWRCGSGDIGLVLMAPVPAFIAALVAFALTRWGALRLAARGARVVRAGSFALAAVALAVTITGGVAVATRPQATAFLAQMPEVGTLPEATLGAAMPVRVDTVGRILVWRRCDANGCEITLRQPTAPTGESLYQRVLRRGGEALRVRYDATLDLAVLEDATTRTPVGAFRVRSAEPVDVFYATLRGRVAPPLPWFLCAVAGLLLALVEFAASGHHTSELRRWLGARPGTLADGVVRFDGDATAATVQDVGQVAPGPVLVFEDAAKQPFREAATIPAGALREGTMDDLRAALTVAEGGRAALAAALAGWSAIPLALILPLLSAR